jgi:hypothetical protein
MKINTTQFFTIIVDAHRNDNTLEQHVQTTVSAVIGILTSVGKNQNEISFDDAIRDLSEAMKLFSLNNATINNEK